MKYPKTLGALKYYLGLTGYLKNYIHYYAQLVSLLQALGTSLLKKALEGGQQHWIHASMTRLEFLTEKELATFDALQLVLSQLMTLVYHNPDRMLCIDLDAFKVFSFGAMAFYTAKDIQYKAKWPSSASMQPILCFSRF